MKFKIEADWTGSATQLTVVPASGHSVVVADLPPWAFYGPDAHRQSIERVAQAAIGIMDRLMREKEAIDNPPPPIKPELLVALREKGYDVE